MAPKKMLDTTGSMRKRVLADRSNMMLDALQRLRNTEERKRQVPISTPTFHELANEVNETSREIFRIAHEQDRLGDESPQGSDTIDEVADQSDGPDSTL